ncbi:hypothetical protein APED_05945 [Acanthopleuribacter pedis]
MDEIPSRQRPAWQQAGYPPRVSPKTASDHFMEKHGTAILNRKQTQTMSVPHQLSK